MNESSSVNILLVDDRPDNLTVLEAVLSSPGYNLVKASSGFEAVALAAATEFAVILLDVQMPGMDGFDTAKSIRFRGASKDSPIIFVTAIYGDEAYVQHGYDSGAVDYIFKPFNPHTLRSKVGVFVDLHRKTKQLLHQSELLRQADQRERFREISELKVKSLEHEIALTETQRRLSLVAERAPVVVLATDHLGRITLCEGQGLKSMDLTPGALVGQNILEICRNNPEIVGLFSKALSKKKDVSGEMAVGGRTFEAFLTYQIDGQGAGGLLGIMRDISEQKMYQRQLEKSEAAQRFLAESGSALAGSLDYEETLEKIAQLAVPKIATWCVIRIIDSNGNPKAVSVSHSDRSLIPMVWSSVRTFRTGMLGIKGALSVANSGQTEVIRDIDTSETARGCDERERRYIELVRQLGAKSRVTVPMKVRGKPVGAIAFVCADRNYDDNDIELLEDVARRAALAVENARLYSEAEQAIRTRDEFLSIASHELRTPITPLKIQFQTISKLIRDGRAEMLTPQMLSKMMIRADRQLDRLANLIEDLLNVARINMGRLTLERQPTNLAKLIAEVSEQFKEQLQHAHCELRLELAEECQGVWDPFKLEQVIVNLITNAIKYGSGQPIRIWLKNDGARARFGVQDGGIGIAPADQERIFERFERAVSPKNYGGLGLGLYIVRNIVEEHGGTINVESAPSQGSHFIVEIPKEFAGAPALRAETGRSAVTALC